MGRQDTGGDVLGLGDVPAGQGRGPLAVEFLQSTQDLEAFDFVEVTARVSAPHPSNPFIDGSIRRTFKTSAGNGQWNIEGFCDSDNGSLYRLRFMPPAPGDYTYSVEYHQGWSKRTSSGTVHVRDGHRAGVRFGSILNMAGTLCGKAPANIIFSMGQPPIG